MSLHTYIERMKYVDYLIRRKATGDLTHLSGKLNLSRSQTCEFINEMKQAGFPIKYCRKKGSYYYTEKGRLVTHFFETNLSTENRLRPNLSSNQLRSISGGTDFFHFFLHSDYMRMGDSNFVFESFQ